MLLNKHIILRHDIVQDLNVNIQVPDDVFLSSFFVYKVLIMTRVVLIMGIRRALSMKGFKNDSIGIRKISA